MKYTLRNLLVLVTVLGIMAATLRSSSPHAVLVMLLCVCGLLVWCVAAARFETGMGRRVYGTAASVGVIYLVIYVATNTPVEAWINAASFTLFTLMKGGTLASSPAALLNQWYASTEFHLFQQKIHLLISIVVASAAGWVAGS